VRIDIMNPQNFGPKDTHRIYSYDRWAKAAKANGLMLVACSSGVVAQDGPFGTCHGFWGSTTYCGWLTKEEKE
jgi:hypothetical protein